MQQLPSGFSRSLKRAAAVGLTFHEHAAAYNVGLFGRKRWFLYPPHGGPEENPPESEPTTDTTIEDPQPTLRSQNACQTSPASLPS